MEWQCHHLVGCNSNMKEDWNCLIRILNGHTGINNKGLRLPCSQLVFSHSTSKWRFTSSWLCRAKLTRCAVKLNLLSFKMKVFKQSIYPDSPYKLFVLNILKRKLFERTREQRIRNLNWLTGIRKKNVQSESMKMDLLDFGLYHEGQHGWLYTKEWLFIVICS